MSKAFYVITYKQNGRLCATDITVRAGEDLLAIIGRYNPTSCIICNDAIEAGYLAYHLNNMAKGEPQCA